MMEALFDEKEMLELTAASAERRGLEQGLIQGRAEGRAETMESVIQSLMRNLNLSEEEARRLVDQKIIW